MTEKPRVFRHFCNRCGRILTKAQDIERGYGPACWKIMKPQEVKPYIHETPFVEIGDRTHQIKIYSSLGDMF